MTNEEEEKNKSSTDVEVGDDSNESSVQEEEPTPSLGKKIWNLLCKIYNNNDFIIQVIIVILLAYAYPPLGADYLQPKITSTWIAVMFIFVLAGLGLKTEEFKKAFKRLPFNLFVQIFNFGVVSSTVFGVSRALTEMGAINKSLADGMVVCASLPLTINMCVVLTKAAGGDEASAIFNTAFGNMIGVFLSPALILGYIGVRGDIELWTVFYKLALRVVLPVTVGQLLQKFSPTVVDFVKKYKPRFKKAQQYALVFIIYTVFCRTFADDSEEMIVGDVFIMIAIQFCLLCFLMALSWFSLKLLLPKKPTLRVMGLFGCTHKTVAMGIPLINSIYESDPLVGLYTLPLLIWHPMQLVLGSFLAPKLLKWVQEEKKRLGIDGEETEEKQPEPELEGQETTEVAVGDTSDKTLK